jgi:outer membrane protein assembly factor BamB
MRKSTLSIALLIGLGITAHASQWTQWRGPNRDGIVPSASVPAAWPDKLTVRWKQEVGEGYSSPVVEGGRVFVHSRQDPEEMVSAFDLAAGKPVWTAKYQAAFTKSKYAESMSKGPFSTPLVADGRLFTLGTSAVLSAFDAATGKLLWRKDWSKEVGTSKLFTGTAMSPVIDSGLLIVHVGDDTKGAFRAFDPASGTEKWSLPGHGPGYASPVTFGTLKGTRQIITMTDKAVVGVDVAGGKLLWQIPFPDEFNENIVTPVLAGDVLVLSGVRKGTFGYRLEQSGPTWTPKQVWHNADLPMYMSSPVTDGSVIYGFSNRRKGQLFCLDATTGQPRWATEGRVAQNASITSAGPNLLMLTTDGELVIVRRTPDKYEEVRRYTVGTGPVWAHPAVTPGAIVVRDATAVAAWSLK